MALKEHINLTISSELMERSRILIPNISKFVEDKIREEVERSDDPISIKDRLQEIEEEKKTLESRLTKANITVNTALEEAVDVLLESYRSNCKLQKKVLDYWAAKVKMPTSELQNIILLKYKEGKDNV